MRPTVKYLKLFSYLCLIFASTVNAKQVSFNKQDDGDNYQFNYQWLDRESILQSLSFSLPKEAIFNRFRSFKTYKPKMAERHVNMTVKRQLNAKPLPNVQIRYSGNDGKIKIKGTNQKEIESADEQITQMRENILNQYLKDNFYHRFVNYDHTRAIKPDHTRFATLSVDDFTSIRPLILSAVSIQNIRDVTNFVLGFVQSIPYSTLESRITSAGAGFNPPLKLLWENQGDCDSKVTLTAALLRSLMPQLKIALVFIDNHALIGVEALVNEGEMTVKLEEGEMTVSLNGIIYMLAEPTGPAMLPLGQTGELSTLAILQKQYTLEPFI